MLYVVLVLVIVGVAAWLIPASRGASLRAHQLERPLRNLMDSDVQDPYLAVRPRYSGDRFIQFRRYGNQGNERGLELAFPLAAWSEDYFPRVVTLASSTGRPYEVVDDEPPGLRFVFVRFGDDTASAADFGARVLLEILEYDPNYVFRARIN